MCQRKIIRGEHSETVPLLNGCDCPMIKEFRHIPTGGDTVEIRKEHHMPAGCYDIHTQIASGVPDHHVVFRHCECIHPSGICMKLGPLLYASEPMFDLAQLDNDQDEYDDDESDLDGGIGLRPW